MDTEASLSIPGDFAALSGARRFTETFLRAHGVASVIDTMVLLVSEVVTNAILHGGSGAELRLILSGEKLRVEVRDHSTAPPSVKHFSETATTGRGMLIVDALATAWGTETQGKGKLVWFVVDAASYGSEPIPADSSRLGVERLG